MKHQTFRFFTTNGDKAWVSTNGYTPRVDDELSLPRKFFPDLYDSSDTNPSEFWKVERVVHRFDDEEFIGADVYVTRINYYRV